MGEKSAPQNGEGGQGEENDRVSHRRFYEGITSSLPSSIINCRRYNVNLAGEKQHLSHYLWYLGQATRPTFLPSCYTSFLCDIRHR